MALHPEEIKVKAGHAFQLTKALISGDKYPSDLTREERREVMWYYLRTHGTDNERAAFLGPILRDEDSRDEAEQLRKQQATQERWLLLFAGIQASGVVIEVLKLIFRK